MTDLVKKKVSESRSGKAMGSENYSWGIKRDNSSSKYIGVCFRKDNGKWRIRIRMPDGKLKTIGQADTEIEAAKIYNKFVIDNNLLNPLNKIE